jgi:hypothetical protein
MTARLWALGVTGLLADLEQSTAPRGRRLARPTER